MLISAYILATGEYNTNRQYKEHVGQDLNPQPSKCIQVLKTSLTNKDNAV